MTGLRIRNFGAGLGESAPEPGEVVWTIGPDPGLRFLSLGGGESSAIDMSQINEIDMSYYDMSLGFFKLAHRCEFAIAFGYWTNYRRGGKEGGGEAVVGQAAIITKCSHF